MYDTVLTDHSEQPVPVDRGLVAQGAIVIGSAKPVHGSVLHGPSLGRFDQAALAKDAGAVGVGGSTAPATSGT